MRLDTRPGHPVGSCLRWKRTARRDDPVSAVGGLFHHSGCGIEASVSRARRRGLTACKRDPEPSVGPDSNSRLPHHPLRMIADRPGLAMLLLLSNESVTMPVKHSRSCNGITGNPSLPPLVSTISPPASPDVSCAGFPTYDIPWKGAANVPLARLFGFPAADQSGAL